jgi:hypothetical protein
MVGRGLVLWTSFAAALWGQQIRWPPYQDEAVRLLQKYLRVDTQNPPGNTSLCSDAPDQEGRCHHRPLDRLDTA